MNKRVLILLQVAVWTMLLFSPLTFMNHNTEVNWQQFLMMSVSPLADMTVFYLSYYFLTPRFFIKGEKKLFWTISLIVCICLGIFVHSWMIYAHNLFAPDNKDIETDLLSNSFFMLRDITELIVLAGIATTIQLSLRYYKSEEKRREAEVARTESELRNLRNQISPHFLLNTLNNIYALTAFDSTKAQEAIQELSRMLRHMLYDNQEDLVEWKDEMQFLKSYVNLMIIRLPHNVIVNFETCNNSKTPRKIVPLLFISLVENAFKHGVSTIEDSFIDIKLSIDDHHIVCDICNSNFPKKATDRSGHGIGLKQVQKRLDLSYPSRYTWEKGVSDDRKIYRSIITISN